MQQYLFDGIIAGCDEAGRGCLAGPVTAAAVVLPPNFQHELLTDSKQLTHKQRVMLRSEIEEIAISYGVAHLSPEEIDEHNILRASFLAMHRAIDQLKMRPGKLLIDGNRFIKYDDIDHECVIKGDGKFYSIAAASILAKTYRDDIMIALHKDFPLYDWNKNKGYPTKAHRQAIMDHGPTEHHRKSFRLYPQLELF